MAPWALPVMPSNRARRTRQLGQLADIEPLHIGAYIEALQVRFEKKTVKQHLTELRSLCQPRRTCQTVRCWIMA
jgi:hypothetical protein